MLNLFKDISPGENPPKDINMVVDIPKDSKNKYEYNEKTGYFKLDRVLYSPLFFPFEYGFIPQTTSEDGDALDVALISTYSTFPGCVIKVRPIGVLLMQDESGIDNKIIAVPLEKLDPRLKEIQKIEDLGEHLKKEIELFFADYKKLEKNKYESVKINGWAGKEKAEEIIKESIKRYEDRD
jgi:inorganic pyrophosphatase